VPDIARYADCIHDEEDRPLFDDAVKAASTTALRAAYVMIWLCCAESIKRRFREAEKRDGLAGKIVGEINKKEEDHKAIDRFLLEKAKEYGFISETAYTILLNIYGMRCLYGHPYEQAPSPEQVIHAAAMVVQHLLREPVRLRHGYVKTRSTACSRTRTFSTISRALSKRSRGKSSLRLMSESLVGFSTVIGRNSRGSPRTL
jgi:hypothetical protein